MHYSSFNSPEGQAEFRKKIDPLLAIYDDGYTMTDGGEIIHLPDKGMSRLAEASLPMHDRDNVGGRVDLAILRFQKHHSSLDDRKHALRDLADVLEYLRPKIKNVLTSKDEADLFNILIILVYAIITHVRKRSMRNQSGTAGCFTIF
jgi:hypothetical protein